VGNQPIVQACSIDVRFLIDLASVYDSDS
jgi:hypothetical protein